MSRTLELSKEEIRKSILELRNEQPQDLVQQKSDRIISNLMNIEEYKTAKCVMLYSGKEKEVQTEKLIRSALKTKRVILPITNTKQGILEISELKNYDLELEKAAFNILEPKREFYRPRMINLIDLFVVPGVAFDIYGNRLGYGFGYYDKLLKRTNRLITVIGLAFEFQVQDVIPNSQYDIPVHFIVTEEKIIKRKLTTK
ncbi:MAG: 5-formyltetrahydrofolate cyclo-ligase [Candidatus Helarchaeota archaeon]|nr:5-formyltetrahydrofolate cyclo-ligase [Candidatus Helarchaeota archaeon]